MRELPGAKYAYPVSLPSQPYFVCQTLGKTTYIAESPEKLKADVKLNMQLGTNVRTLNSPATLGFGGFGYRPSATNCF
jgi:hypothetical protein